MRQLLKNSQSLVGLVKAARMLPGDVRRARWMRRRKKLFAAYFEKDASRKLQIGAGANWLEGWLNTDYMPRRADQPFLDATKRFPFEDNIFECVYSEHVIEHLWYADGLAMLREAHRVLKAGGRVRIATPNLRQIVSLLNEPADEVRREYIRLASDEHIPLNKEYRASFVVNNFFWDFGHYFVYDPETLRRSMEIAGFKEIMEWCPGESDEANLRNIETHGKVIGEEMNRFETMVLEGVKA